jgi:8-oxo-dGTP diphosphatase
MIEIDNKLFQVSVKGLYFNDEGKLMMIQEDNGKWELPGGRIEKGEEILECLARECKEELGLEVTILEKQPFIAYSVVDHAGVARIFLCYKIEFSSLDFTPNEECRAINFFSKEEIKDLDSFPQVLKIVNYL